MKRIGLGLIVALLMMALPKSGAQAPTGAGKAGDDGVRIFHLKHVSNPEDGREIYRALRSVLYKSDEMYFEASRMTILMRAQPQEIEIAEKVLAELDRPSQERTTLRTFFLKNITGEKAAMELSLALRNVVIPQDVIYYVPSQNALIVRASQSEMGTVESMIAKLDRPAKSYKLTYTVTEMDGGRAVGTQHFTVIAVTGERMKLTNGVRVPLIVASAAKGKPGENSQVQYVDVGVNIDVSLDAAANGLTLRTKLDRSSLAEERSSTVPQDPVIRQNSLESTTEITPGKPLRLGSLDIPGSTRHLEVEVEAEPVP